MKKINTKIPPIKSTHWRKKEHKEHDKSRNTYPKLSDIDFIGDFISTGQNFNGLLQENAIPTWILFVIQ